MPVIRILKESITDVSCDIVVNAANADLADGGGIDGILTKSGNLSLLKAQAKKKYCDERNARKKKKTGGRCRRLEVGDSVFTDKGTLTHVAKGVIHSVGPKWGSKDESSSEKLLRTAYLTALQLCVEEKGKSILFPFISTGIYGCPMEKGVNTAIESVLMFYRDVREANQIEDIIFVTLSSQFVDAFTAIFGASSFQINDDSDAKLLLKEFYLATNKGQKNNSTAKFAMSEKSSTKKVAITSRATKDTTNKVTRNLFAKKKSDKQSADRKKYEDFDDSTRRIAAGKRNYQQKKEQAIRRTMVLYYQNQPKKIKYGTDRYEKKKDVLKPYQRVYQERVRAANGLEAVSTDQPQRRQKITRPNPSMRSSFFRLWARKRRNRKREEGYFREIRKFKKAVLEEIQNLLANKRRSLFNKVKQRLIPTKTNYYRSRVQSLFRILDISKDNCEAFALEERLTCVFVLLRKNTSLASLKKNSNDVSKAFQQVASMFSVRENVHNRMDNMIERFLNCLTMETAQNKNETEQQYAQRRIMGVQYHVFSQDSISVQRQGGYRPLAEVYAEALSKFRGSAEQEVNSLDFQEDVEEVEIEVNIAQENDTDNSSLNEEHNDISCAVRKIRRGNDIPAKLCSDKCVLPSRWLPKLLEKISYFQDLEGEKLVTACVNFEKCVFCETSPEHSFDDCTDAHRLLKNVSPHFNGIRSLLRRYQELRRFLSWLQSFDKATSLVDIKSMQRLCSSSKNPVKSSIQLLGDTSASSQVHHEETCVIEKYGPLMTKFFKSLKDGSKTLVCDICYERRTSKEIVVLGEKTEEMEKLLSVNIFAEDMVDIKIPQVCRRCYKDHKAGKMAQYSFKNNLQVCEIPEELKCLSLIERTLISLYRPCQAVFKLQTQRGRGKHLHIGSKGVALVVPNNPEGNVERVLTTLPNTENLKIVVESVSSAGAVSNYIVDMAKVMAALRWLKQNNVLYKDVKIDDKFQMDDGQIVIIPPVDSRSQPPENACLTPNFECIGVTERDFQPPADLETIYGLKRTGPPIDKLRDENLDMMAYPHLYPYGEGGMFEKRKRPIPQAMYLRHQLNSMDRTFARDQRYILERSNTKDIRTLTSKIRIHFKKKVNGRSLMDMLKSGDPAVQDLMYAGFSAIPSSPAYWSKLKGELRATLHFFKPPTFFLTLNPAEHHWSDLFDFLKTVYPEATSEKVSQLCTEDPALFSEYFHLRIRTFVREVLLAANCPLGEVIHYLLRFEWQKRGAPHMHSLLWIKGAPKIGESSDEEVIAFINARITCRRPNIEEEPELSFLVETHQTHRSPCTATCSRTYRDVHTQRTTKKCRFNFPRPASDKTKILSASDKEDSLNQQRLYQLQRTADETMINDYNPAISLMWKGNIDIQFVSHMNESLVNYVLSYASKPESKSVLKDLLATSSASSTALGLSHSLLKKTETSSCEAADRLLGSRFFERSHDVTFIDLNPSRSRCRVADLKKLKDTTTTDGRTTMRNVMDDYYKSRPKELHNISLANYIINFVRSGAMQSSKPTEGEEEEEDVPENEENDNGVDDGTAGEAEEAVAQELRSVGREKNSLPSCWCPDNPSSPFYKHPGGRRFILNNNNGIIRSRFKPCLFRVYLPDPEDSAENQEDFYRRLLILFKPWLDEPSVPIFETWTEEFEAWIDESSDVVRDTVLLFAEQAKLMHIGWKASAADRKERAKQAQLILVDDEDDVQLPQRVVNEQDAIEKQDSMNTIQREIFGMIMEHVKKQCDNLTEDPLLLFVTGCAGTGKTHLIECLADALTIAYRIPGREANEPAVILSAFTGLAAMHVKGSTLHSLLTLSVQIGREQKYEALGAEKLQEKRVLFRNCHLFIIDEVSMVSNILLTKVHLRLQEIKGNLLPFGGVNVLVTGDLLQLPPVMASAVFEELSGTTVNKVFGSIGVAVNLWNLFRYRELSENMRQRRDLEYANLMGRYRLGNSTDEDIAQLRTRYISVINGKELVSTTKMPSTTTLKDTIDYYLRLIHSDEQAICLCSTNDQVDQFNSAVTKELYAEDLVTIIALDTDPISLSSRRTPMRPFLRCATRRFKVKKRAYRPCKDLENSSSSSGNRTAGLLTKLVVAIGARVMLRRNIDSPAGLVNGALGVVVNLDRIDGEVLCIHVKFDHLPDIVPVTKVVATFKRSANATVAVKRLQFPLALAYAMTVHKAQGLSADNVIIDLTKTFEFSQGYVAFSRARSLNGIHIVGINNKAFGCLEAGVLEYNRLRTIEEMLPFAQWNTTMKHTVNARLDTTSNIDKGTKVRPRKRTNVDESTIQNGRKQRYSRIGIKSSPETKRGRSRNARKVTFARDSSKSKLTESGEEDVQQMLPEVSTLQKKERSSSPSTLSERKRRSYGKDESNNVSRKHNVLKPQRPASVEVRARAESMTDWPHKFENPSNPRKTMCFLNSTVQCLFAITAFTRALRVVGGGGTWRNIVDIFHNGSVQVLSALRARFPELNDGQQHDADEFLQNLMDFMPVDVQMMFQVNHNIRKVCRRCDFEQEVRDIFFASYLTQNVRNTISLDRGLDTCVAKTVQCYNCKAEDVLEDLTVSASPEHKILVLIAPLFHQRTGERRRLFFRGDIETRLQIGESNYRAVAVIVHMGETMNSGHYIARVRQDNGWVTANDDNISFDSQCPLENIYMMFYEKEE